MDCPACEAYEETVVAGAAEPPTPCDHYEMSDALRDWIVARMRGEVLAQVSAAGLDRMAVVRDPD